ncbi:MAG: hypothetical protein K6G22_06340 [Lachnospiraceae bacterium]|nr:hypothetical protein [Lachnospiraceae bacterium]
MNTMENITPTTEFLKDNISKCEDIKDLKETVFPMLETQKEQWMEKISGMIEQSRLSKTAFAKSCNVSRVAIDKWCKGAIPKNRETFLRIGLTARYDRKELDRLLQRYGGYPALYPKTLEDCICIFIINQNFVESWAEKYQEILDKIKTGILSGKSAPANDIDTVFIDNKLGDIQSEDELGKFIAENIAAFSTAYNKFYAYVEMCIVANYQGYADSVFELAEGQGWSSSLRQCVSAIRQKKWYPTRNKIISLGLHLSMDHEQINELLQLAHMEPLCAKNIFESVIMFILDDASLNNILEKEDEEYDPDELCRYARDVLEELELPEIDVFISELPENEDE